MAASECSENYLDRCCSRPLSLCSVITHYEEPEHRPSSAEVRATASVHDRLGLLERIVLTQFERSFPNHSVRALRYTCSTDVRLRAPPIENCVRLVFFYMVAFEPGLQTILRRQLDSESAAFFERHYLPFARRCFGSLFDQDFCSANVRELVDVVVAGLVYVWRSRCDAYTEACARHWIASDRREEERSARSKVEKKTEKRKQQALKSSRERMKKRCLFSGMRYEDIQRRFSAGAQRPP